MTTNVAGPTSGYAGQEFTYTVTIGNNALTAADGAPFTVTPPPPRRTWRRAVRPPPGRPVPAR
ncbi:hypothetical protein ACFQ2M_12955 [Kitasatospora saccharophila]|uniref:hypothetical protein n=1 Tax=Kitasatospora saccharophila TaxID=407973 RepID=UPI0036435972